MIFNCKRFAFVADPHIENNKNLPFIIKTFKWIKETLKKEDIDYLFIAGDFINSRIKIDSLALNKAVDILNDFYEDGIEVFLLLGNHEKYTRLSNFTINSIKPFEKHSHIIDDFTILQGDNYNLFCLPSIENNKELQEAVEKIVIEPGKYNILLGHQSILGATSNDLFNITDKTGLSADIFSKFDRVFMGHFHKRQQIGNVLYIGSPVQLSFGEEFSEKGVTIWNTNDNSVELIVNPDYEIYKTIDNLEEDVKDKFVRYITNEFLDSAETKSIKETLLKNGALEAKIEIKHKAFEEIAKDEIEVFDMNEIVKKYVEINSAELDKDKCFQTYSKIRENQIET